MRKGADQHYRQTAGSKQTVARVVTGSKRTFQLLEIEIGSQKFHPHKIHTRRY